MIFLIISTASSGSSLFSNNILKKGFVSLVIENISEAVGLIDNGRLIDLEIKFFDSIKLFILVIKF